MMLNWGRGMNGGRLTSTKCIYSCLLDYDARETSDWSCALEALCQAAASWACLLAKLVRDKA